jgi:hypothetical protein
VKEERPQATAWFPPFPPAETVREVAVRVSPGPGQRGVAVTKSMFREPIMVIWGFLADGGVVVGVVLDIFVGCGGLVFGVWCSGGLGALMWACAGGIQLKDV